MIAIGTVPAVIVGGLGAGWIDENLGEPWMIAVLLIVFGLVLWVADRRPRQRSLDRVRLRDGLYIGLAQVPGPGPGRCRARAITISAGRFLGLDRDTAARISFLMLAPVTAGAAVFKGYQAINDGLPNGVVGPIIVGMVAAAISGYLAIAGLLALVRRHTYEPFVIYRLFVGVGCLLLIATGVLPATF